MIRSFDIFDTCLTRRVEDPGAVFSLMARDHGLGSSFRFHRQEAEREATRRYEEATLAEIYSILSDWLGYDKIRCYELIAAELEEEARQFIPIPGILFEVRKFRVAGGRVAFLSDMYLPSLFLGQQLKKHGFFEDGDLLLVSCEQRKSKTTGGLYREASQLLQATTWEHFGNDSYSDVEAARKAGLKGTFCDWGNLSRYESLLASWHPQADWARAIAGAARSARMKCGLLNRDEQTIATVSAGVAAPLVFIFTSWLVERALALDLKTVYFLARDGQVLVESFKQIASARNIDVQAKYLYASRIALRFPRDFPMSDEDASGVFQGIGGVPISVVAARLGIPESQLRKWITAEITQSDIITTSAIPNIRSILEAPEIIIELEHVTEKRSKLLIDYLLQEGFLNEEKPAVVDLGWNGSLQAGLQKALKAAGSKAKVHGLYLGLASFPYPALKAEAFLYDNRIAGAGFAHWITSVSEVLCQADHGTTLGFDKRDGIRLGPVLDVSDGDNPLVPGWLTLHRKAIQFFVTEVLSTTFGSPIVPSAYRRLLIQLLETFWLHPSREEGCIWGACQFSSHGLATTKLAMAPSPGNAAELLAVLGIKSPRTTKFLWREGAAAKLPAPLAVLSLGVRKTKVRFRKRLQRLQSLSNFIFKK